MRRLEPIVWSKGTLLSPQLLQQQDAYVDGTSQFHLHSLHFQPWGFRTLLIDREALAGGYLALSRASGMLSDGLLFDFPQSDPTPEPKALAGCFSPGGSVADFYLAIRHIADHGVNVASEDPAARYRPSFETVRDENDGKTEKPVQVARKNFRLVEGAQLSEGLAALRVARVTRTSAATYELDESFIPSLLDISASNYLLTIARRLVEILTARSTALAGARRERPQAEHEFTAADIPNFWLLYTVNSNLPVFRHIYESRSAHPEGLFSAMLDMTGELATFSRDIQPCNLPVYDHSDLQQCFTELDQILRSLLETAVPRNYVSLPLKQVQPSMHATSLDDDRYLVAGRMYLAVRSDAKQGDIAETAQKLIKVGSGSGVEHLVRQALPGLGLTLVPLPPGALPLKLDFQYFALEQTGSLWDAIVRARNLAVYVPAELPDIQLELVILLPQSS